MKTINILASLSFLVSCSTITETKYEKQTIPSEMTEIEIFGLCESDMQSEASSCLLSCNSALKRCNFKLQQIESLAK